MRMLQWQASQDHDPGVALVFGSGLIGSTVEQALMQKKAALSRPLAWDWSDLGAADTAAVAQAVLAQTDASAPCDIAVIWAAGTSGFGTDDAGMAREYQALEAVIALAHHLGEARPKALRSFHLVSSAGGLFEGQVACARDTAPDPLRPYGAGKIAQENLVAADEALGLRRIYRPSSVYGYARGGRWGLISVLILRALQAQPAHIMGAMTTLRDYIFAPDIGAFIADRVCAPGAAAVQTALLASGRPASIFEISKLIETRVGARLFLQIDPNPENARDNTFLKTALPADFRPTGLTEGIERTALFLRKSGVLGGRV